MHLIEILNALFQQDVTELLIRKSSVKFEEFDKSLQIENIRLALKGAGHNELLLNENEIEDGFKKSSIYYNDNKRTKQ